MKLLRKALIALGFAALACSASAQNHAWPANYEGVMLQGFAWDSYADTKWTNLESQADELSASFDLIWVPNSGRCGSGNNMGYMPQYWFTNHNSSFGTEAQLRSMINTFKEKGTGIIADVVINHRNGVTNWTDFPVETWNGQTWKIGPEGICCNDEVANASGQARPTGAYDTGDNFDGARDLDHTNANVQNNCKNYVKCLLEDFGYAGVRYDMVKGYSGQYTKMYNEYANTTFSVGEYWDANYDAVKAWIEATGRQSAAFDFPGKYAINEAFGSNDLTKLVWKAYGTTDQPAGMIHAIYGQYAVTFVDNHDTYRDGSKFNGDIVAANAFILCSPGTPCVFLPHWQMYKAQIKKLIAVRKAVGVHNLSTVKVLKSANNCYMAEVTGSKGKLAVRIGSASDVPAGYTAADVVASGTNYCVWTKTGIEGGDDDPIEIDEPFDVYFNNAAAGWTTPYIHYWGGEESTWPGVPMTKVDGYIWKYTVPAGTIGLLFNAGDGDNTKTSDFVAQAGHIYTQSGDQGVYEQGGSSSDNYPEKLYILGNLAVGQWTTDAGVLMDKQGAIYTANDVEFALPAESTESYSYFTLVTALGADWDVVNGYDRYGAASKDALIAPGESAAIKLFPVNVSASAATSWKIATGSYNIEADLEKMTLSVKKTSGIDEISVSASDVKPVYYNLQGVSVENPSEGLYIVVRGDKVSKEYIR